MAPNDKSIDQSQLLKGVLDMAVLAVLASGDGYGYDVVRRLRAAGLVDVAEASVYGTLRRLFSDGALNSYVVPSDEGPHRKYYGLTESGRAHLAHLASTWSDFTATIDSLVTPNDVMTPNDKEQGND